MKIVLNKQYGGFALSRAAYAELGIPWDGHGYTYDDDRCDPALIACVEKLAEHDPHKYGALKGDTASGRSSTLVVVEIPDDIEWTFDECDGFESIHEAHRSW